MAPSHVSKQTIHVAQATSSRSGRRQVHTERVEQFEEMAAENDEVNSVNEDQQIETDNDTGSPVAEVSQVATGSQLTDLLSNMVDDVCPHMLRDSTAVDTSQCSFCF